MDAALVPGASIAVVREGEIQHTAASGIRNADAQQPVTAETVFAALGAVVRRQRHDGKGRRVGQRVLRD